MYARLALFVVLGICILGCPGESKVPAAPKSEATAPSAWRVSKSGVGFRLSNADAVDERTPAKSAAGEALSEAETRKVLDRLPKLAAAPGDEKDFALRAGSLPAPRTGKTLNAAFPPAVPPSAPPAAAPGPLRVLRHAPDGPVDLASNLAVTFSAPMVAVTSQGELATTQPPVRLTPQPPGTWRWVGTQTLLFEPAARARPKSQDSAAPSELPSPGAFPMATDYDVEIPAGTRAANGAALATAQRWKFSTPAPKIVTSYPNAGAPVRLDPVIFVAFDQAIDPQAVLKTIEVTGNARPVTLRLATTEEVDAVSEISTLVKKANPELGGSAGPTFNAARWLAFRPNERLSPGAALSVHVRAGTSSREGPKKTAQDQSFAFRTHGALRVTEHTCGWEKVCRPLMPLQVLFSNPLDAASFDKSLVRVEPPIAHMKVSASAQSIEISGQTRGKTTYKVTVGGALRDQFEQTLGRDATVSFTTERSEPELFREQSEVTLLEPAAGAKLPIYSVNHTSLSVQIYSVRPQDWAKYTAWRTDWDADRSRNPPPGELAFKRTISPAKNPDDLTETMIDLAPALQGGLGQVVVVVEPTAAPAPNRPRTQFRTWVQATNIALTSFVDSQELVTFATTMATGAPLAGVDVSVFPGGAPAKTGPDGLARVRLGANGGLVLAQKGNDIAFLPNWGRPLARRENKDQARWFVFDDRRTYKPGEEVRVKGWVRRAGMGKGGDLGFANGATQVEWTAKDQRGNEFEKGVAPVDKTGALDLSFKIPDTANLGYGTVQLHLQDDTGLENVDASHGFSIQEFRRPEFEVTTQASEGPHFVGGHAVATMSAAYYAGGGLPNTETQWTVTRSDAVFTPPNRSDYVFGRAPDFFGMGGLRSSRIGKLPSNGKIPMETWSSVTDGEGKHRLRIDFDALDPAYPMDLRIEASLSDVNRQRFASTTNILVHPGAVYVGIRRPRTFVRAGSAIDVAAIATDIDGHAVRGRKITVSSARLDWEQHGEEFSEVDKDVRTCDVTSGDDAVGCALATTIGGRYRVTAVVTDEQGRRNQSETLLWVVGDDMPPDSQLPEDALTIVPDKEEYQPGDVAELLLMAPFSGGEAVVSVGRQGIVNVQRVTLARASATVRIPLDAGWVPNVYARVQVSGLAPRKNEAGEVDPKLPKRPAYATGFVQLKIAPRDRKLQSAPVRRRAF